MKGRRHLIGAATVALGAVLVSTPLGAVEVLDYCLENGEQCAISVHHVTEGWERHLNADRLQATASTFKILTLIVYAQAVADGRLDPEKTVTKEEWAKFWVGRDGGALSRSWENLGRPDRVTVDQIMRQMIEESDNASPDWLLDELGGGYFKQVLARYVAGYHDVPESIGATFLSWEGSPAESGPGRRMLAEYSGIDALGYRKEVARLFRRLNDPDFAAAARRTSCSNPPWEAADPGCDTDFRLSVHELRRVAGGFSLQSNTRTYNRLLLGILDESLLPPAVQEIVVRHLEWQLELPEAAALATRLGTKGGSLSPQNVCNFVSYAELRDTGEQVVVSVFLQDVPVNLSCDGDIRPFELLEGIFFEEGFKQELENRLAVEEPRPDLIARLQTLKHKRRAKGDFLKTRLAVGNLGVVAAEGPFEVWLVASDDARADRGDTTLEKWVLPFLAAGETRSLRFKRARLAALDGRILIVRVDRKKEVGESDESNDRPWQILR